MQKLLFYLKEKSGKIIQSLLSIDDTAAIVKCSGHVIKFKENFVALIDEAVREVALLPQCLTKTQQFF